MNKPEGLRAHLVAALPMLQQNPDRLLVFIDEGGIVSTYVDSLAFEWRYTLNLIFTDLSAHPDEIAVPLLEWLRVNQPELLGNPERRNDIRFEADVLANDRIDLSIKIPLTERVGVRVEGGQTVVEHFAEPAYQEFFPGG